MLDKRSSLQQFCNCQILRNSQILKEDLWVRDGKVINPEKIFYDEKVVPDLVFDCRGSLISPGYIDLQMNGKSLLFLKMLVLVLPTKMRIVFISTWVTYISYICKLDTKYSVAGEG